MKNIKVKVMALVLVIAMVFTGCMNETCDIKINSDGSALGKVEMLVNRQATIDGYKKIAAQTGEKIDETELAKQLDSSMTEQGYKKVVVDGKEYYQMSKTQVIKKGNLQKEFATDGQPSYVTTDTVYFEMDMSSAEDNEEMSQISALTQGSDMKLDLKITFNVEMPKKIVNTNGVIDKENPNKASITTTMNAGKKIVVFVTTKAGTTIASTKALIKKLNTVKVPKIKKAKANKVQKNAKKATVTLKFNKVQGAKRYQIQYGIKNKKAITKYVKKNTVVLKKLTKNKKYVIKVRAEKKNYADQTIYSKWSKKTVKTKK